MKINNQGLKALTVESEQTELEAVGTKPLILRYHKGSEKMGKAYGIDCRLWDVLTPLDGYPQSGGLNGYPTLSLEGLKERGLIRWF